MTFDAPLKKDVVPELEWDPSINATEVGLSVREGVVGVNNSIALKARITPDNIERRMKPGPARAALMTTHG